MLLRVHIQTFHHCGELSNLFFTLKSPTVDFPIIYSLARLDWLSPFFKWIVISSLASNDSHFSQHVTQNIEAEQPDK